MLFLFLLFQVFQTFYKGGEFVNNRGFTLVELMIVLLLVGILSSVIVPNYSKVQRKAKEQTVKQIVAKLQVALESYYLDSRQYPSGVDVNLADLESVLIDNEDLSSASVNPFTGEVYSDSDESGVITYSYDSDTDSYEIKAYGYKNAEELLRVSN